MICQTPVFESGSSVDITDGLVSYIPLGTDGSDTVSGDTYTVTSGAVTYDGKSVYLDGASYMTSSQRLPLPATNFSLSLWVNPADLQTDQVIINSRTGKSEWNVFYKSDFYQYDVWAPGATDVQEYRSVNNPQYRGIYTLFTITFDGALLKIYENDVLMQTINKTTAMDTTSSNTKIGVAGWNNTDYKYKGSLARVRGYNKAISQDVVSKIFNDERTIFGV